MIPNEPKQVILVRTDLNMPVGKIASQVAHSSLKVILDLMNKNKITHYHEYDINCPTPSRWSIEDSKLRPVIHWLENSFVKICLGVDSIEEMEEIERQAIVKNIPCAKILDEGRTVFNGIPTITTMAIGPYWKDEINKITGHLSLLK